MPTPPEQKVKPSPAQRPPKTPKPEGEIASKVNANQQESQNENRNNGRGRGGGGGGRNNNNVRNNNTENNQRQPRAGDRVRSGPAAGTGEHLLKLRVKKGVDGGGEGGVADGVFDFEAGLEKFNKEEVLAKVAAEPTVKVATEKYKKDDFFDTLSGDTNDRTEGHGRRNQHEERALNQDTFGAIALQSQNPKL